MQIVYQTERLDFIRVNQDLINEYVSLMNDENIYIYINLNHTDVTVQEELDWINRHQDDYTFSIIEHSTGEFVGNCALNAETGEFGIVLRTGFQHMHYGTEAIEQLINIAFNELNLDNINLVAYSFNHHAINCYNNLGFTTYQIDENVATYNNEQVDDIYMRLTRN